MTVDKGLLDGLNTTVKQSSVSEYLYAPISEDATNDIANDFVDKGLLDDLTDQNTVLEIMQLTII